MQRANSPAVLSIFKMVLWMISGAIGSTLLMVPLLLVADMLRTFTEGVVYLFVPSLLYFLLACLGLVVFRKKGWLRSRVATGLVSALGFIAAAGIVAVLAAYLEARTCTGFCFGPWYELVVPTAWLASVPGAIFAGLWSLWLFPTSGPAKQPHM